MIRKCVQNSGKFNVLYKNLKRKPHYVAVVQGSRISQSSPERKNFYQANLNNNK
jgi:hypothetical protein